MKRIEDVDLKEIIENETGEKFNRENKIHSPFNSSDKNPSFSVYFNSNQNKWVFKDFSTGEYGDGIDFIMKYKNLNYNEARKYLNLEVERTVIEEYEENIRVAVRKQVQKGNKQGYKPLGVFVFVDENNNPIYAKVKFLKPDGKKETPYYHIDNGQVVNNRGCDKEYPYNLYKTLQAINKGDTIIFCEGEKDCNKINSILKKGYQATSVKNVKNIGAYFKECKIYVIPDNDNPGEEYKDFIYKSLYKDSKEFKIVRLPGLNKLGKGADITDWLENGHNKKDLFEAFKKSLNLKSIYELQQDKHGIYKITKEIEGEEEKYKRDYISNFNIVGATLLNYVDDELNNIEITFKDEYGKIIKRNGNVTVLEDVRSFKCFLNSLNLTFEGTAKDLIKLKKWINTYFVSDYCEVYKGNQFREVNNELLFVSPSGAIGVDKVYDDIKSDEKTDNNILNIEPIGNKELQELMQHLFKFSDYKNTYSIIGTVINDITIYQAMKLDIKFSHLLIVGESGSGKSTILEKVVAALLNYPISDKKSIGSSSKFSITKDLSTGNYPIIYDEYKPSMMDKKKNDDISDKLRNAYDRNTDTRGTKNQEIKRYRAVRPIIMAGEESYKGEEKALYNRSCIVYLSKEERTQEHTNNMKWIERNTLLLNKFGRSLIQKVLSIDIGKYKMLRGKLDDNLNKYSYLNDRTKLTAVSICTGIEILNMILQDYKLPVINDYSKYIADNLKTEVLDDGSEKLSAVEKMLIMLNDAIECGCITNIENFIFCKNNELDIVTKEIIPQLNIYLNRICDRDTVLLSKNDFDKQAQKAKYIIEKSKQRKFNGKNRRCDRYDINKIRELELYSILGEEELTAEPIGTEENKILDMFNRVGNGGN